jgi:hypothetical protein
VDLSPFHLDEFSLFVEHISISFWVISDILETILIELFSQEFLVFLHGGNHVWIIKGFLD